MRIGTLGREIILQLLDESTVGRVQPISRCAGIVVEQHVAANIAIDCLEREDITKQTSIAALNQFTKTDLHERQTPRQEARVIK